VIDKRDPAALGAALLAVSPLFLSASRAYDRSTFRVPDHVADPSPIEKYGDPRTIPSTMPNAME
jgi:hypothetical protein